MKLYRYDTTETLYNRRVLTDQEYNGIKLTKADDIVNTEDVIIPNDFAITHTSEKKITKAINFYKEKGYFDKPITVIPEINEIGNPNKLILIDGLSRYIAAIRLKTDIISVKYIALNDLDYILN